MRKRRVIFLIEVESKERIQDLKDDIRYWLTNESSSVIQIQTNVVQKRTISKRSGKR